MIKFSVLTTVYNREQFLAEAIESVLGQSYPHFELILVDDCSVDSSLEIAKKYEQLDSRVKVFVNDKNLGDYPNRNRAISLAQNEYIKFLDADDYFNPDTLEQYRKAIMDSVDKKVSFWVNSWSHSESDCAITTVLSPKQAFRRGYVAKQRMFEAAPNSCLYRRSILNKIGGFKEIQHCGDYEMAHRLASKGNVGLVCTRKPLAFWREHAGQQKDMKTQKLHVFSDYIRISMSYVNAFEVFFSELELRSIREDLIHLEAQLIRSTLGRAKWAHAIKVIRNLHFPLPLVLRKVGSPYRVKEKDDQR